MGLIEGVGVGWWISRVWMFMLSMRKFIVSYDHSDVFFGGVVWGVGYTRDFFI